MEQHRTQASPSPKSNNCMSKPRFADDYQYKTARAATTTSQGPATAAVTSTAAATTSIKALRCSSPSSSSSDSCFSPHFIHVTFGLVLLTMGSCFGRCDTTSGAATTTASAATTFTSYAAATSCLWRQATDEQDIELISNASDKHDRDKDNFIYRIIKFKRKRKRSQFIERFLDHPDLNYDRLASNQNGHESNGEIQLQNLDVHSLMNAPSGARESAINSASARTGGVASSRASSSLDLEWEHEYSHMQSMRPQYASRNSSIVPIHKNATTTTVISRSHNPDGNNLTASDASDQWHLLDNVSMIQDQRQFKFNQLNSMSSSAEESDDKEISAVDGDDDLPPHHHSHHKLNHKRLRCSSVSYNRSQSNLAPTSFTRTSSSHNSWSHISTPESLEWDIDEEQQRQLRFEDDNLGHETLQLLHEIEELKNRVLNETGDNLQLLSSNGGFGDASDSPSGSLEFSTTHFS